MPLFNILTVFNYRVICYSHLVCKTIVQQSFKEKFLLPPYIIYSTFVETATIIQTNEIDFNRYLKFSHKEPPKLALLSLLLYNSYNVFFFNNTAALNLNSFFVT